MKLRSQAAKKLIIAAVVVAIVIGVGRWLSGISARGVPFELIQTEKLHGHVAQIHEETKVISTATFTTILPHRRLREPDVQRAVIGGPIRHFEVASYDTHGALRKKELFWFWGDSDDHWTITYNYNKRGDVTGSVACDNHSVFKLCEATVLYPKKRRVEIKIHKVNAESPPPELFDWWYRMRWKIKSRKPWSREVMKLDDAGRISTYEWRDRDGKLILCARYIYDGKGRLLSIKTRELDSNTPYEISYRYNDRGFVSEEKFIQVGSVTRRIYSYEYDTIGNWSKKTMQEIFTKSGKTERKQVRVTTREIKYYPKNAH